MKKGPLDRPLGKGGREVSLSAFSFLFSEMIQDAKRKTGRVPDLEGRLEELGRHVGVRLNELLAMRHKPGKRETSVVSQLSFILTTVWKQLFGRAADNLEKSVDSPLEYWIVDTGANVTSFVSLPKGLEKLSVASFVAGIVRGILDSSGFTTEHVQAHNVPAEGQNPAKTVIVVRFLQATITRDQQLQ